MYRANEPPGLEPTTWVIVYGTKVLTVALSSVIMGGTQTAPPRESASAITFNLDGI